MPSPPRSARSVLSLLAASTGLVLAAQPDAKVELLPGTPTTVLISSAGRAQAAFVLPISEMEACKAFGKPAPVPRDRELEAMWEEDRHAG